MSKKILDAVIAVSLGVCLFTSSNIAEKLKTESAEASVSGGTEIVSLADDAVTVETDSTDAEEHASVSYNHLDLMTTQESDGSETELVTEEEILDQPEIEPETEIEPEINNEIETETEIVETPVYENRWGICLTDEEIDLLARIVWVESRGESNQGQEAVVEVVFNRMASGVFPNTLYDVLSQRNPVQFASWKRREKARPTEKEYASIYRVLSGETSVLRMDTVYFARRQLTGNLDIRIGGHSFCY
jgi:N-acetylmuramoyl-L-alanine amidase